MKITPSFLKPYIRENKRHKNYKITVELYKELKMHADGEKPGELLMKQRPGESAHIFKYRNDIYQPKTMMVPRKILNSLAKIGRSVDWNINYEQSAKVSTTNSLQQYCEVDYPKFGSLTNWFFEIALKQALIDPNAVVLARLDTIPTANQLPEPTLEIFNSDQVLDFVEGSYAVLKSKDLASYTYDGKTYDDGEVFFVITLDAISKITQANPGKTEWTQEDTVLNIGMLPCYKLGGLVKETGQQFLYESRIQGIVPSLNSAVLIISDIQAERVQHVHSLMWQYQTQVCKKCNGLGTIKPNAEAAPIACDAEGCNGGTVPTSPYSNLVLNANTRAIGQQEVPIPLAGYIQKNDVALMHDTLSKAIQQEIFDAYAAVSMEFLMDSPLATSGLSKQVDRDELNNFVHSVASDSVSTLTKAYTIIALMRYGYTAQGKAKELIPTIPIPQKFDLLSDEFLVEEIAKLVTAGVDPVIIAALEAEYMSKKFKDNPELVKRLQAINKLNPFPGVKEDDLMTRMQNGGIDELDYIIHCNLFAFITRAKDENEAFYTLTQQEQQAILDGYAEEKQGIISGEAKLKQKAAAAAVAPPAPAAGGDNNPGGG